MRAEHVAVSENKQWRIIKDDLTEAHAPIARISDSALTLGRLHFASASTSTASFIPYIRLGSGADHNTKDSCAHFMLKPYGCITALTQHSIAICQILFTQTRSTAAHECEQNVCAGI